MSTRQVVYHVNGVAVSWWRTLAASRTFWVAAGFVLTAAQRWNQGEISGGQFFQIVQIGVTGILIRAAMARTEIAVNAGNPQVPTVQAKEEAVALPTRLAGTGMCVVAAASTFALSACCC